MLFLNGFLNVLLRVLLYLSIWVAPRPSEREIGVLDILREWNFGICSGFVRLHGRSIAFYSVHVWFCFYLDYFLIGLLAYSLAQRWQFSRTPLIVRRSSSWSSVMSVLESTYRKTAANETTGKS
jgi:hypothetical protein